MRLRGAVVWCAVFAWVIGASAAFAQATTSIDQIPQRGKPSPASVATPQVARTGSDRTSVTQLPGNIQERRGAGAERIAGAPQGPLAAAEFPSVQARNAGSIDPDEIARLLDRGEAASIDAAAALATGAAPQSPSAPADPEDEPDARRRPAPGLVVPPRT